jgi:hypothetical protein
MATTTTPETMTHPTMTDAPTPDGDITIRYDHFLWLNKETLRLGHGWRDSDIELKKAKQEIAFLKMECDRLRNNAEYLDSKLDDELDGSLDSTKHIAAIYSEVQKAKDALDKCGTLETSGIEAWRILNNLLTPPPLP